MKTAARWIALIAFMLVVICARAQESHVPRYRAIIMKQEIQKLADQGYRLMPGLSAGIILMERVATPPHTYRYEYYETEERLNTLAAMSYRWEPVFGYMEKGPAPHNYYYATPPTHSEKKIIGPGGPEMETLHIPAPFTLVASNLMEAEGEPRPNTGNGPGEDYVLIERQYRRFKRNPHPDFLEMINTVVQYGYRLRFWHQYDFTNSDNNVYFMQASGADRFEYTDVPAFTRKWESAEECIRGVQDELNKKGEQGYVLLARFPWWMERQVNNQKKYEYLLARVARYADPNAWDQALAELDAAGFRPITIAGSDFSKKGHVSYAIGVKER